MTIFKIVLLLYLIYLFSRKYSGDAAYCGLFGFSGIGGRGGNPDKIRLGLLDNESRGSHATGIWGNNLLLKDAINAQSFIGKTRFDDVASGPVVIGHTRHKTMGDNSKENAHPYFFSDEGLVATHNGWLIKETMKPVADKWGLEVPDVDSKLIYQVLIASNYDYDEIQSIPGTMALAFYRNGFLHLMRRPSKPLYIGQHKDGLYYSSLTRSLNWVGCDEVFKLQENVMYIIEKGSIVDRFELSPSHLNSLPEDVSPSQWRTQASIEELKDMREELNLDFNYNPKKEGEDDSKFITSSQSDYRWNKYGDYYGNYYDDGYGDNYNDDYDTRRVKPHTTVFLEKNEYYVSKLAETRVNASLVNIKVLNDYGKRNGGDDDYSPELSCCVYIEGMEAKCEYTNAKGLIANPIKIEDAVKDRDVRIVVETYGLEDKTFKTGFINVPYSTVSEVIVYLPRFQKEEKEVSSKSGDDSSVHTNSGMVVHKGSEDDIPFERDNIPIFFEDPEEMRSIFTEIVYDGELVVGSLKDSMDVGGNEDDMREAISNAMSYIDSVIDKFSDAIDYIDLEIKNITND